MNSNQDPIVIALSLAHLAVSNSITHCPVFWSHRNARFQYVSSLKCHCYTLLLPSSNPRWAERFELMCEEFAWTAPGVSQAQFEEFLGDEVDYTDDDSRLYLWDVK